MVSNSIPLCLDTVVVGNGPSALILSFILHGNIPYYIASRPHPDPILDKKLSQSPCLLDIDVNDLTAHFTASRLSYSTQALPINVLLDTLIRPLADTDPGKHRSCVEWRFEEEKAVSHAVLGNTMKAGGQWADNPVSASWDIGALSYSEMLSLPGYAFEEHYQKLNMRAVPDFYRPTRREVAVYLATYPDMVGIADSIYTNTEVGDVFRTTNGFHISSHNIDCKHLVLASGVFSTLIPPRPLLQALKSLPSPNPISDAPLLVVGSGFTAADVIISTPPDRKILHIFKWEPENHPSPLRACHPRAYPEYASVYRHMKLAAINFLGPHTVASPMRSRKTNPFFQERDWLSYEGLPNTYIKDISMRDDWALLTLEAGDGRIIQREISSMDYVIGRRGSLSYLDEGIAREITDVDDPIPINLTPLSGQTLRSKVERSLEIAADIFATGSLTGDSLIRFAYGGCVFAAREILKPSHSRSSTAEGSPTESSESLSSAPSSPVDPRDSPRSEFVHTSGHFDLHLDKKMRSMSSDQDASQREPRQETGSWAGGCTVS